MNSDILKKPNAQYITVIFLCLAVCLGGSSQDSVILVLPVYMFSIMILCYLGQERQALKQFIASPAVWVLLSFLVLSILQSLPLPPFLWTRLPGREVIVSGYILLGDSLPWLPISMTPLETMRSSLAIIPALAACMIGCNENPVKNLQVGCLTIVVLGLLMSALGVLQLVSGDGVLRPHTFTNESSAVGLFANRNHFSVFIIVAIVALIYLSKSTNKNPFFQNYSRSKKQFIAVLSGSFLSIGVVSTSSVSGMAMLAIIVIIFLLQYMKNLNNFSYSWFFLFGALTICLFSSTLYLGKMVNIAIIQDLSSSSVSRLSMAQTSLDLISQFKLVGSGLGSFESVYLLHEDRIAIQSTFIEHAHNDYLELIVEFGFLGAILAFSSVICAVYYTLNAAGSELRFQRSHWWLGFACLLVAGHSFVDYPLRTLAMNVSLSFLAQGLICSVRSTKLIQT